MANKSQEIIVETWISEKAFCIRNIAMIIIYRADLNKIWRIVPLKNKYYEEEINAFEKKDSEAKGETSIHKIGYNYQPVFDWVVKDTSAAERINNIDCRRVTVQGEADFAQKSIEIWFAKNMKFTINDVYKKMLSYLFIKDDDMKKVFNIYKEAFNCLPMKIIETTDNAISPKIIYETEIKKIETADPPAGVYELPKEAVKVNSLEELNK